MATPSVAGLIAYLLSVDPTLGNLKPTIGWTARKAKSRMLSQGYAYARQQNNVAIFNGYLPDDDFESCGVGSKRDIIGKRQCQRPTKATYTIDGVPLTGVPTSLSGGGQTVTAGGPPITISGITFSLPASATNGAIYVDGTLTHLPAVNATAMVLMSYSSSTTQHHAFISSVPKTTERALTSSTPPRPSPTKTWNVASYTGPSTVIPSTWCDLTLSTNGVTLSQTYSTISGALTSFCDYAAIPGSTISLTTLKPPILPSSTRSTTSSTPHIIEQTSSSTTTSSTTTTTTTTSPTFDPAGSTTLCHATFGTWTAANHPTSVPRIPYTGSLNSYVNGFCTTTQKNGITLDRSNGYSYGFVPIPFTPNPTPALPPGYSTYYEFSIFLDRREECKNVQLSDPVVVEPIVPSGPYFDCWDPLQRLVNGCDAVAGLDKWGGTIERGCIVYGFQAWVGPTIREPRIGGSPCGILGRKRFVC